MAGRDQTPAPFAAKSTISVGRKIISSRRIGCRAMQIILKFN
jgi:hypothetical protein